MMKFSSAFPAIVFAALLSSLSARSQVLNIYGNQYWIADSLTSVPTRTPRFSGKPALSFNTPDFFGGDFIDLTDSNAYSRLNFKFGGNENQDLHAEMLRPLSAKDGFSFFYDRAAYPGWMAGSRSRHAQGGIDVLIGIPAAKLTTMASFRGLIDDKSQNGGLRSKQYSIENASGEFNSLNSDVFLNSAYNRRSVFNGALNAEYQATKQFYFAYRPGFELNRFVYNDLQPVVAYYKHFVEDTLDYQTKDSLRHIGIQNEVALGFVADRGDSVSFRTELTLGRDEIWYLSNGLSLRTDNTWLRVKARYERKFANYDASLMYVPLGYNAGELLVKGALEKVLDAKVDSTGTHIRTWLLESDLRYHVARPQAVFELYRSNFYYADDKLKGQRYLDLSGGIRYNARQWKFSSGARLSSRANWLYLEDTLQVKQATGEILIGALYFKSALQSKRWNASIDATYQQSARPEVYSLPEFATSGSLTFKFPMFKRSIYLQAGTEALYFSRYHARAYLPFLDMFYVQNDRKFGNYIQVNPLIKVEFKGVDVVLRMVNAAYGIITDDPLVAPGYPSIPRYFQIEIDWRFKN